MTTMNTFIKENKLTKKEIAVLEKFKAEVIVPRVKELDVLIKDCGEDFTAIAFGNSDESFEELTALTTKVMGRKNELKRIFMEGEDGTGIWWALL